MSVADKLGNIGTDSAEVTPLETDTSVTNLPLGDGATHGVELGSSMVCESESPCSLDMGGCHLTSVERSEPILSLKI